MMQFKDRLKLAMELGGIGSDVAGMRALAEYLGVTGASISQALKGQTVFNARNSARAARMLDVDLYWFATGEGDARNESLEDK
jgi:transcriptional regulator with XRE-family HTH domain